MHLILLTALTLAIAPVQPEVPNKQPAVATQGNEIDLTFGSGSSIWLARSVDGGRTFAPPAKVVTVPAMALGRHRGPRVVISGKTIVISAVYGGVATPGGSAYGLPLAGNLVSWHSTNQGVTWSKPVPVNDVPGAAREGLHAMVAGENGEVAAVWLDLRAKGTQLYGAYSRDGGASWSKNVLLYQSAEDTICQCCHPSLASLSQSKFAVMFRNVVNGSRDLYRLTWDLQAGATHAVKLGSGSWMIDACPMDGGGIAPNKRSDRATTDGMSTVSAWRRAETVYLAAADGTEQAIGNGKNIALATTSKGSYVAWTGTEGIQLKRPDSEKPVDIAKGGDYATLTALPGNRVALAWEEKGEIRIRMLP